MPLQAHSALDNSRSRAAPVRCVRLAIHMRYFDLAIVALYLVGITIFGARFRHGQKSLKDYFLG